MGSSTNKLAESTTRDAMKLEGREFALGSQALTAGTNYLTDEYRRGGTSILDPKWSAMTTDALEASARPTGNMRDVGAMLSARALGTAGVANQRLTAGLDELSKLRSLLSSHGLQTTGLGQAAQGESLAALAQMPEHPGLSTGLAIGAAGAGIYGGFKNSDLLTDRPQTQTITPVAPGSFMGSDISLLRQNPESYSLFGGGPGYFNYGTAGG